MKKYINELSVTGLTSNPTIFDNAISKSSNYDGAIRKLGNLISDEELFFELAVEDIQRAADLFRPVYDRTNGVDGFVSIEVSPTLAYDTQNTIDAAKATSQKTYEAYLQFLQSNRVQRVMNLGVSPQRLLWASTGAKDPAVSDVLYVENLVSPFTVNTMPENTLLAFANHGKATQAMPISCTDTNALLEDYESKGINTTVKN